MRRKSAHLVFLLAVALAGVVFTFNACRDSEPKASPKDEALANYPQSDEKISYEQFLKEMEQWKDQSYYNHFRTGLSNQRTTDSPFAYRPTPSTTDSVRRISVNNHTTYTIVANPMSRFSPIFHNFVIDSSEAGVNTLLLMYLPKDEWVKDRKRGKRSDFYGKVIMTDYLPLSRDSQKGRVNQAPICTSVMVLSQIVEHLCCHNQQAHSGCNCAGGSTYYLEYLYNQVTTCIDVDIPPSGGGFSGGTGGGTVPNPGGGYDPCDNGVSRTSKTPCTPTTPTTPDPTDPLYVPNAVVNDLINFAATKGVSFEYAQIPLLNGLNNTMVGRIKDLIGKYGAAVKQDVVALYGTITGKQLTSQEIAIINAISDGSNAVTYLVRLCYAANAFAAQSATAANYGLCASFCESCKGNAFKHALFLIYNAEIFTYEAGVSLGAAHEEGQSGLFTEMDKKNNAAGAKLYKDYNGSGTPTQWATRVKNATDQGINGMVCVVNNSLISTKLAANACQ